MEKINTKNETWTKKLKETHCRYSMERRKLRYGEIHWKPRDRPQVRKLQIYDRRWFESTKDD